LMELREDPDHPERKERMDLKVLLDLPDHLGPQGPVVREVGMDLLVHLAFVGLMEQWDLPGSKDLSERLEARECQVFQEERETLALRVLKAVQVNRDPEGSQASLDNLEIQG